MTVRTSSSALRDPPVPEEFLAQLDAKIAASMLSTAADITVVMTPDGVICDRVLANQELSPETFIGWPGKAWIDTVTVESRPKIEQLLQDAVTRAAPRWRQINHPTHSGVDIPVRYSAVQVGPSGNIIAIGRDMGGVAALQRRLVAAEQSIEQEYAKLRATESRYRLLMQVASEAIMIVDTRSGRVSESNPAAASLIRKSDKRLNGSIFKEIFSSEDTEKIETQLASLRSVGHVEDVAVKLHGDQQAIVSSTLFRQDNVSYFLVRMSPLTVGAKGIVIPKAQSKVVDIIEAMPDGFVVTDMDRVILTANAAFLDVAQLGSEEQARGEPIDRWLGRPGVDAGLLLKCIREHGSVRQFQTIIRGQFGTTEDIEVSGVSVPDGQQPCFGFTIRRVTQRTREAARHDRNLPRSVDELTKMVGKVPLKDLVRDTTDIIEKLCIEAALQLNEHNRASTADMLGLSRQSLYMKLHRYGIDEPSN